MVLSNNDLTATTTTAWNQVQTEQELLPNSFIEFRVDDICGSNINGYGMGKSTKQECANCNSHWSGTKVVCNKWRRRHYWVLEPAWSKLGWRNR